MHRVTPYSSNNKSHQQTTYTLTLPAIVSRHQNFEIVLILFLCQLPLHLPLLLLSLSLVLASVLDFFYQIANYTMKYVALDVIRWHIKGPQFLGGQIVTAAFIPLFAVHSKSLNLNLIVLSSSFLRSVLFIVLLSIHGCSVSLRVIFGLFHGFFGKKLEKTKEKSFSYI